MSVISTELKSTKNDDLFIYFDDHGDAGMLCFTDTLLYADDLKSAMKMMEENGKYGRCFFGIEACYSGSVDQAIDIKNTLIVTVANAEESSYAAVYDKDVGNYLSNEFTNIWIDLMDKEPQFAINEFCEQLREQTKGSHSCLFGDIELLKLPIETFFGTPKKTIDYKPMKNIYINTLPSVATYSTLARLARNSDSAVRARTRLTLHEIESLEKKMDLVVDSLVNILEGNDHSIYSKTSVDVSAEYLRVIRHFCAKFGKMNHDGLSKLVVISNLVFKHGGDAIISAINKVL